jgi:hypothetical protein
VTSEDGAQDLRRLIRFDLLGGCLAALLGAVIVIAWAAFPMTNIHVPSWWPWSKEAFLLLALVLAAALAILNLTAAFKLAKGKRNSPTWGRAAAISNLPGFPFGTLLGVFGLRVLAQLEVDELLADRRSP